MKNFLSTANKNHLIGFGISLIIFAIIASLLTFTRLLDRLESGAINYRFYLRDPAERIEKIQERVTKRKRNPKAREDIIILGIDLETIRTFGEDGIQWPFPWNVHAKFTKYVGSGKPLAVFFDIMFLDHKTYEKELAQAIAGARNVFLDYPFESRERETKYSDLGERMKILNRFAFPVESEDKTKSWVEEVEPPTPLISNAAKGIGFANVRPDADSINRRLPLLIKYKGAYYPSIVLLLAMQYYGIEKKDIEIRIGRSITLKNLPPKKMKKPNPERSISIPIDHEGFMDINFIGGSGSFNNLSYHYFYQDGTIPEENTSLKDKILLVAAYSATGVASDVHKSPYGDLYGIEHHANALNTILNQDFIITLSDSQNMMILLIIAVIFGILFPRISIIKSIILAGLFTGGYAFIAYLLFEEINLICIFATPILQCGFTFTVIVVYRVFSEQKEKRFIKQTFSKFLSKEVVEELLKDPAKLKLGGEKDCLTVLFSDIRGFTTMSEKLTPEKLVELLNEYLAAMTEIVLKSNGTLDKYIGDAIMAFWGAPVRQEDHALRACRAAIEMTNTLELLNQKWAAEGKEPLHIGIGINTGDMVVGYMGSPSRMDYTLMGDMVNLGSRLEGTNKVYGTGLIISEFTYEYVKEQVIVRELDLIRVKGKEKPVKIYELIDLK